jgi:hypothetical protein
MLEKAIADIQSSITKEERYSVEAVALILDMARGCYDPNTDCLFNFLILPTLRQ